METTNWFCHLGQKHRDEYNQTTKEDILAAGDVICDSNLNKWFHRASLEHVQFLLQVPGKCQATKEERKSTKTPGFSLILNFCAKLDNWMSFCLKLWPKWNHVRGSHKTYVKLDEETWSVLHFQRSQSKTIVIHNLCISERLSALQNLHDEISVVDSELINLSDADV